VSSDSGNLTSSVTSRDENLVKQILFFLFKEKLLYSFLKENNRSRLNSTSSDISQTNAAYVSPPRQFKPPSDIESEHGDNESDHESNLVHFSSKEFLHD
jgi:hypothetical protein